MTPTTKLFLLDTNVILHDSSCLYQFQEHDIAIPITVLEELDQFKKGSQTINYHAREFVRTLDGLCANRLFNGGVPIGEGRGRVSLKLDKGGPSEIARHFPPQGKPDHQILSIAYQLAKEDASRTVVLVSKDVNLRMKAKAVGLLAEDYTTDHVRDMAGLHDSCRVIEEVADEIIDRLHADDQEVSATELDFSEPWCANEYMVLRNPRRSVLTTCSPGGGLRRVHKRTVYGITPRNAEQSFAVHALGNEDVPLVSLSGKAGTGKTLLALAAALEQRSAYRQILLARPVVPLSNRDLGYLPGDIQSKLSPYMQPLHDNLAVIRSQFSEHSEAYQRLQRLLEEDKLVIEPLTYIRGRSLVRMFLIVDEAQNLTPHEVKTIITRAGDGTKVVFTGDIHQIDHPYLDRYSNGLSYLIERMRGQAVYAHVGLKKGERSRLAELASNLL